MNIKLLRAIKAQIKRTPEKFNIHNWFGVRNHNRPVVGTQPNPVHNCNTTACIAGWAIALSRPDDKTLKPTDGSWGTISSVAHIEARETLGLTHEQAYSLFYLNQWPSKYFRQYYDIGPARAACNYIEYFIKKNGDVNASR